MLTVEQVMSSHKANIETLLGLTTKAFEGVEKIVELNLTASKAALAESGETAKAMLSVKDAQEFMAVQAGLIQPLAEKTAAYSRHLYDIASGAAIVLFGTGIFMVVYVGTGIWHRLQPVEQMPDQSPSFAPARVAETTAPRFAMTDDRNAPVTTQGRAD